MEYSYKLRIPKERVGVLIGTDGETKKELEESTDSEVIVDSKTGEVTLKGEDNLILFELQDVVKAIGRGFNPKLAKLLLKQDYTLDLIKITDHVKDKSNHLERARGRVIGKNGKSREQIETITESYVSVYGKTVAIIGTVERVQIARRTVEKLLNGAPHANAFKEATESIKKLKKRELLNP